MSPRDDGGDRSVPVPDDRRPGGTARDEVLARIRRARGETPAPAGDAALRTAYRRADPLPVERLLELFHERCADYGATVVRASPADTAAAVAAALGRHGARCVVRPDRLPAAWQPDGFAWTVGDAADPRALDTADAVVTGCAVAIAQTGTVVLDAGPDQGPRVLTLLPDHHVCVVRSSLVVHLVPEAIERLAPAARAGRPLTLVSGSSATSDIELERVAGVHGPRVLDVVLVDDAA